MESQTRTETAPEPRGGSLRSELLGRAKTFRRHADEVRIAALEVRHAESRVALSRLAVSYERMADDIERTLLSDSPPKAG